jgi:6-phosphogluconolactonase
MIGEVVVVDDVASEFVAAVSRVYDAARGGQFRMALSGGTTARQCYEALASRDGSEIDWATVSIFWGDERCVPLDDPDSNFRLADEALLSKVGPVASVHPMRCDDGADTYDRFLRSTPPLHLVHLGLGPDGHTASLFPESSALDSAPGELVCLNDDPVGTNPHRRMTLTFAGIERAEHAIVTVSGVSKQQAFARVLAGDQSAPAARLRAKHALWIVDRAALGDSVPR